MSITVNLYYTGTNGNAGKFAEEMMKQIAELRDKYKLCLRVERYVDEGK